MQIETLSCNNCGAPIEVPDSANYVTCAHCGSRLAVHRTDTAHYTEVLEKLSGLSNRADQMDARLQKLQIDNELLRLDQDWEEQRRDLMINTKYGPAEPTLVRAIASAVALVVIMLVSCFLLFPQINSGAGGAGAYIFLILLISGGFCVYAVAEGFLKYNAYSEAEKNYYQLRSTIEGRRSKYRENV